MYFFLVLLENRDMNQGVGGSSGPPFSFSRSSARERILVIKAWPLLLRKFSNGSRMSIPTPLNWSTRSRTFKQTPTMFQNRLLTFHLVKFTSPPFIGSAMPCSLAPSPAPPQPILRNS